jgi:hypothetical protein
MTVAPIEHGGLLRRAETPIVFDNDVTIAHIPAWYRDIKMPEFFPEALRRLQQEVEFAVLVQYSSPALTTKTTATEVIKVRHRAYENVMLVQMAFWLAGMPLDIRHVTDCGSDSRGGWEMPSVTSADHMLYSPDAPSPEQFPSAALLSATYKTLRCLEGESTLRVAVNMVLKAITEPDWILRYLCHWLALEALFGAADGREISFRLSQRIAFHLRPTGRPAKDTFDKVKEGYTWRSKVVHGLRLKSLTEEHSRKLMNELESIVRDCVNLIARNQNYVAVFNGREERERHLDALPFESVS